MKAVGLSGFVFHLACGKMLDLKTEPRVNLKFLDEIKQNTNRVFTQDNREVSMLKQFQTAELAAFIM